MKIASFAPDQVNLDVRSFAVPIDAYTAMQNMRNVGDGVARAAGETIFAGTPTTPPKFAAAAVVDGIVWLVYMGAGGVFATDGVTHYDISPAGWADFTQGSMTAGTINGYLVFASSNAPPWYWDKTLVPGAVKPLPGWLTGSPNLLCLAAFNQHVFAGSMLGATQQYERLAWSDLAALGTVPATWLPTATNQAGELVLGTGGGPVRGMRGLGPQLMVYRTVGAFAVSYVGRPYIYTSRKLSAEAGAASTNAVVEVRGSHVILSPGDLIVTDGTNLRSIGEARVKSNLFGLVSGAGLARSHVYANPAQGEVVFCMCIGNDDAANLAYVWNYERDKWTLRDLPDVAHSTATYLPSVAVGDSWEADTASWESDGTGWDSTGQSGFGVRALGVNAVGAGAIFQLDEGELARGVDPITAGVERIGLPVGDITRVKLFKRLYPVVAGSDGQQLSIQVGASMSPAGLVSWSAPQVFTFGGRPWVDALISGRFAAVRITGVGLAPWTLSGFQIGYDDAGLE